MAENQAKLRAAAEARAAEEAERRTAAEAKAAQEALSAAAAKEKARADEEANVKAAAEARARAEAKAAAEAETQAAARAKAATDALSAAAAKEKARADAEAKAKTAAEAKLKAAEEARARAEATAEKESKLRAAAEAKSKAEEKARIAAETAQTKADNKRKSGAESGQNCWFYTCEGERLGPVSFEELRTMATHSSLDPRLDMIWKKGMDEWKPAGQIDGLFQRQNVSAEPTKAASSNQAIQAHTPQQISPVKKPGKTVWPGADRKRFLLVSVIFPFAWQYALKFAEPFIAKQFGSELMDKILPIAPIAPLIVLLILGWARLANLGMTRWWCLGFFAPILNLWLGYRCFACPPGYSDHQKMDGLGIALAILYWLIVLAAIATLVLIGAVFFGDLEIPAVQEQIQRLLKKP